MTLGNRRGALDRVFEKLSVGSRSVLGMEEMGWVSGLDRRGAADAVVEARARLLRVEADRLALAVHWADLHDEGSTTGAGSGRVLPGSERAVLVGGDGTPRVAEFAVAELAVLMQISLAAAASVMADGLDLRHRLPLLWAAVMEGSVEAWKARKVAARVRSCGLSQAQALWVDTQVTPYLGSLSWSRLGDRLEAKIVAADPEAAEERARAQALARFVRTGRSNEYGLSTIVARAAAGDAVFFVAMCDRLAQILALEGDTDPVEVRRSKAVGILADPARALAMLQRHATLDGNDEHDSASDTGTGPAGVSGSDAATGGNDEGGDAPVDSDAEGRASDDEGRASVDEGRDCDDRGGEAGHHGDDNGADAGNRLGSPGSFGTCCTTCGVVYGDPSMFVRPMRVDPAKLRPAATLYIHTSREDFERRTGVARVEGIGPVTLAQVVELLGHANVTVREVIDLDQDAPVDAYEVPDRLRETLLHRSPATAFPWGPVARRGHDVDHTVPYRPPDEGGPPGQTRLGNLGFLDRRAHRVKTHASGWRHLQPEPGVHYWRTPAGYWFRVDPQGSHALGRNPALPWETRPVTSPYELVFSDLLAG